MPIRLGMVGRWLLPILNWLLRKLGVGGKLYLLSHKAFVISILTLSVFLAGCSPEQLKGILGLDDKTLVTVNSSAIAEGATDTVTVTLAATLPADVVVSYTSASATATDFFDDSRTARAAA